MRYAAKPLAVVFDEHVDGKHMLISKRIIKIGNKMTDKPITIELLSSMTDVTVNTMMIPVTKNKINRKV
jgi:hypothetical protein